MPKVFIPTPEDCRLVSDVTYAPEALRRYNGEGEVTFVDTADTADIVVLFEAWGTRFANHIGVLNADPFLARHWQRVVTVNWDDLARGFLPGLHVSLTRHNFDPALHRACAYPGTYNALAAAAHGPPVEATSLLFSFRGTDHSDPVRQRLCTRLAGHPRGRIAVVRQAFHAHTEDQKAAFVADVLDSKFALCPRGFSPATYRMFEVMELGRCPVVISDDWVPIGGVAWDEAIIRVREGDLDRLPQSLAEREQEAPRLGANARRLWEEHFAEAPKYRRMMRDIVDLMRATNFRWSDYRQRWSSRAFHAANGWLLHQKAARRLSRAVGFAVR